MKIKSYIFFIIFLSCGDPKIETSEDILPKNSFINLLKDIHLAEAKFEIQKTKGMKNAKRKLANNYSTIYETHEITPDDFDKTLDYYAQDPEQLEKVYILVLEQLTSERSILDQQ